MTELKNEFSWSKRATKYSKPAHGEGCTEDNEEGLGSFVRKEGKA
jgi:hypothetical protein